MDNVALVEVRMDLIEELYAAHAEIGENDHGFSNPSFGYDRARFTAYAGLLIDHARGVNLPAGFVPQTTYALLQGDRVVGISRLRHALNEHLRRNGGHIGYFIRQRYRGCGYGNGILSLTLSQAWRLGLDQVLLTVHAGNTPSRRVIARNGGRLEAEDPQSGLCSYWIQRTGGRVGP